MLSGQGSQYYQMGKELYDKDRRFRAWMDYCDSELQMHIDVSLVEVLYRQQAKSVPFDRIEHTNPAILCMEYSLVRLLIERGIEPDYLLGYSLGEFSAAVVSGVISLEDGIALVVEFARQLVQHTEPSLMLAVIGSTRLIEQHADAFRECWVTAENLPNNFVVTGRPEAITGLQKTLMRHSVPTQLLPVRFGFHTELMDPLEQAFKERAARVSLSPMRIPIVSARTTQRIEVLDAHHFWDVTRYPVRFEETLRRMLDSGDHFFVDVGPSGTLATFAKHLIPAGSGSECAEVMNQFGRDLSVVDRLHRQLGDVERAAGARVSRAS